MDVVEFMGITGAGSTQEAENFLEMAGGNLADAVSLYMDLQGGGGAAMMNDQAPASEDVRAPMDSFEDQIVDMTPDQRNVERMVEQDADAMRNRMRFDNGSGDTDAADALNSLFAPPSFNDQRQWYECMQVAKDSMRWIFVNIQHKEVFQSHKLNRDLWSDETVVEIMSANFVFWQRDTDSAEGPAFCERYRVDVNDKTKLPFLGVIDPRTGQMVKTWNSDSWARGGPHVAADYLYSFIDRNSLQQIITPTNSESAKRPMPIDASSASNAEPMKQKLREQSPPPAVKAPEPIAPEPVAAPVAQKELEAELPTVDESAPTTQVLVRFMDGSKRAFQFNETHLVADLYAVVYSVMGTKEINVCGGFPPKPLTDEKISLRDAGLCQSSVTVRKK